MSQESGTYLTYYSRFSESFLQDIAILETDVAFEERGGEILYAIDFSEIWAYSQRSSEAFFASSRLAQTVIDQADEWFDSHALLIELHEMLMQFVVFRESGRHLLLEPYILELRDYVHNLKAGILKNALLTARDIVNVTKDHDYAWVQSLAKRVHGQNTKLSAEDAKRLTDFLTRVAPSYLLDEHAEKEKEALARIREITQEARISRWEFNFEQAIDEPTYVEWRDALNSARPGAKKAQANEMDATAIATVVYANKYFAKTNQDKKLRLISRSPIMQEILHDSKAGTNDPGLIRHPRAFLALLNGDGKFEVSGNTAAKRRALRIWKTTFETLGGVETEAARGSGGLTTREIMRRRLATIMDAWRRSCKIPLVQHLLGQRIRSEDRVLEAIRELADGDSVRQAIRSHIFDIVGSLSGGHVNLVMQVSEGFSEALRAKSRVPAVANPVAQAGIVGGPSRILLYAVHGTPLAFEIMISEVFLRNAIMIERHGVVTDVIEFLMSDNEFASPAKGKVRYDEWYLLLAYAAAAIGSWEISGEILKLIRDMKNVHGVEASKLVLAEVRYLSARVTRYLDSDIPELEMAAKHLSENFELSTVERWPEDQAYDGVRYLSEWLKIQMILCERALGQSIEETEKVQRIDDLRLLMDRLISIDALFEHKAASCSLLNNICYHSVELERLGYATIAEPALVKIFEKFVEILVISFTPKDERPSTKFWPDNFADTFVWVATHLRSRASRAREIVEIFSEDEMLDIAERLVSYDYLGNLDRDDFQRHRDEILRIKKGV